MLDKLVEDMLRFTQCFPWYWYSYGEKCFSVVEAITKKDGDPYPEPGSRLLWKDDTLVGENDTEMLVFSEIMANETQNGDTICAFVAGCHANLLGGNIQECIL